MTIAWLILTLIILILYVALDGYDLGVGMLSLFEKNKQKRFQMIELVAGIWDANETYLIMLGLALWGGFPLLFGMGLQHMYPVIETMIFGLILRGFSVEMISSRGESTPSKWYIFFGLGSGIATLMMGIGLGSLVNPLLFKTTKIPMGGFKDSVMMPSFTLTGGTFNFLSWYSALFAVTLVAIFIALGFAYLKFHRIYEDGKKGVVATVVMTILVGLSLSLLTKTESPLILSSPWRIATFIGLLVFVVVGITMAITNFLNQRHTFGAYAYPMVGLLIAFTAILLAIVVTHYPYITPGLSINAVSAPKNTYLFLLVGIGLNVPLLTYYTYFAHHILLSRDNHGVQQKKEG